MFTKNIKYDEQKTYRRQDGVQTCEIMVQNNTPQ